MNRQVGHTGGNFLLVHVGKDRGRIKAGSHSSDNVNDTDNKRTHYYVKVAWPLSLSARIKTSTCYKDPVIPVDTKTSWNVR